MNNFKEKVFATSKNVRISPWKVERMIAKIRGKSYQESLQIVKYWRQKSGVVVWQTLYSAVSNGVNNFDFKKEKIVISEAFINQGPIGKRVRCGSKGSPKKILKRNTHITIGISEL